MHVSEMVCKVMVKAFRAINKLKMLEGNLQVFELKFMNGILLLFKVFK